MGDCEAARGAPYRLCKRIADVVCSMLAILLLSPVWIPIAALIKITSRGPIFFRQERVGLHERPFCILKFRSMKPGAERRGLSITGSDDPRVTHIGRFLRRTKLDEIPQLINVLCGEMSLVGPRPEVPKYVALYTELQREVLSVRPGMTDTATVCFRDEEKLLACAADREDYYIKHVMPFKLQLNLEYLKQRSLLGDFRLLALQFLAVVLPPHLFRRLFPRAVRSWESMYGSRGVACSDTLLASIKDAEEELHPGARQ